MRLPASPRLREAISVAQAVLRVGRKAIPTPAFRRQRRDFYDSEEHMRGLFAEGHDWPMVGEASSEAGSVRTHYFQQDLYVAQAVAASTPERHIDVGSRIDGFVAHIASFRRIEVCDLRPLPTPVRNVTFHQLDITAPLPPTWVECSDSVSSLHAIEHFGLGRYGDNLDYLGHVKGLHALGRMVQQGGALYFSVPISQSQRIEFNAQRVFCLPYIMDHMIPPGFALQDLSIVDDQGQLSVSVDPASVAAQETFGLSYGCGIFSLAKVD